MASKLIFVVLITAIESTQFHDTLNNTDELSRAVELEKAEFMQLYDTNDKKDKTYELYADEVHDQTYEDKDTNDTRSVGLLVFYNYTRASTQPDITTTSTTLKVTKRTATVIPEINKTISRLIEIMSKKAPITTTTKSSLSEEYYVDDDDDELVNNTIEQTKPTEFKIQTQLKTNIHRDSDTDTDSYSDTDSDKEDKHKTTTEKDTMATIPTTIKVVLKYASHDNDKRTITTESATTSEATTPSSGDEFYIVEEFEPGQYLRKKINLNDGSLMTQEDLVGQEISEDIKLRTLVDEKKEIYKPVREDRSMISNLASFVTEMASTVINGIVSAINFIG